jgi:transglutaminase-like putative cysteine protease
VANEISRLLSSWTSGLNDREAVRTVFERVRDIPYGTIGSRDPLQVVKKRRGTCSGKHLLLANLYRLMDIDVHDMIALHYYAELPRRVEYPAELAELVTRGGGVPDYHNFITAYLDDRWVTLDATFDYALRDYVVVNEWDGHADTELSVRAQEIWEEKYPLTFKERKLAEFPQDIREQRVGFLERFSEWLQELRTGNNNENL